MELREVPTMFSKALGINLIVIDLSLLMTNEDLSDHQLQDHVGLIKVYKPI